MLGIALSRIAGKPFEQLFNDHLVSALDLGSTSFTVPTSTTTTTHALIPNNSTAAGWNTNLGIYTPAGGNSASTNDIVKIGRAILNSSLLPSVITRRWLKPSSFVNDVQQALGRPWEIIRLEVLGRTVDVYAKTGDWGVYHSLFALVPDYQIGFTVFTAADAQDLGSAVRDELPEMLAKPVIQAVDAVAKEQARANFVGTYRSRTSNSSITFTTDESSALRLTAWVNNGTDLYGTLVAPADIDFRILPNGLYGDGEGARRVGFTSLYVPPLPRKGWFGACANWASVDQFNFGNVPLGQFVFEVDASGRATGVESKALRVSMEREG